jgi:hypothetical protein
MSSLKKTMTVLLASLSLFSTSAFAMELEENITMISSDEEETFEFEDVKYGDQYYSEIQYLLELGTVNGYDDGTFKPLNTVTRAELVKIVTTSVKARFEDDGVDAFAPYKNENCFSDVTVEDWHSEYICFAEDHGWINGYDDGSFKPAQEVTFVEALKIAFLGFDLTYNEGTAPWYQEMVDRALYYAYIPETVGSDYLKDLNRGELAAMIRMMVVFDPDAICPLSEHFLDGYEPTSSI